MRNIQNLKIFGWLKHVSWPLLIVPVLTVVLGIVFARMAGDFPDDPEYSYLLNGLEVLTFYPPSYISHPGTNLIMLMAVVNFFVWLVSWPFHGAGLVTDVLARSQFYLAIHHLVLMAGIAGAALWFGAQVRRVSGSLAAALAGQATILLSYPIMIGLNRVAPEPLLVAVALVLAGFLAPLALDKGEDGRRTAAAAGIVLGFGLAAKINALPLAFALLLLPDWRLRKRAALFALGTGILCTLPAAHHYPQMFHWFGGMATHSGTYSDGSRGLPQASVLLANGAVLLSKAPEMFAMCVLYAFLARLGPRSLRPVMLASALVVAAQILMVLKQPEPRYLIPAAAFSALANAALVFQLLSRKLLSGLAAAALMAIAAFCCTASAAAAWTLNAHAVQAANRLVFDRISHSGCAVILYYEAPAVSYSLDFGNQYAGSRFRTALQKLYPRTITYDWARNSFMSFGDPLSPAQVWDHVKPARCIYLAGSPLERFGKSGIGISPSAMIPVMRAPFDNGVSVAVYRYQP